jgi:glycerol-3-phosphate dehydrogenase
MPMPRVRANKRSGSLLTPPWTRASVLPGGDFPADGRQNLADELAAALPSLGSAAADRLARTYGTMAREIFGGVSGPEDLGTDFGAGLYEREVGHLVENEWAMTAEDILWRRTKLGLRLSATERGRLSKWLAARAPAPRP